MRRPYSFKSLRIGEAGRRFSSHTRARGLWFEDIADAKVVRSEAQPMKEQWWCTNCGVSVDLDTHGRCSACGSDAVDSVERRGLPINATRASITPFTGLSITSNTPAADRVIAPELA